MPEDVSDTTIGDVLKDATAELQNQIARLKAELAAARKEAIDWNWAYQLTEGILKNDPKWNGVTSVFSNGKPIEAARLAKEVMGKRRPTNIKPGSLWVPNHYQGLVEWLEKGTYRAVYHISHEWKIRDEAKSRQIIGWSIDDMLKSKEWEQFRKVP